MKSAHRPFLSLLLCLALAVNLLAPFAHASPLFVEICSGHRTVLVPAPSDDAQAQVSCEACPVCWVAVAPPEARAAIALAEWPAPLAPADAAYSSATILPRPTARAPPLPTV